MTGLAYANGTTTTTSATLSKMDSVEKKPAEKLDPRTQRSQLGLYGASTPPPPRPRWSASTPATAGQPAPLPPSPLVSQFPASTASSPTSAPAGQLQCGCTNAVRTDGGVYRNCRKFGSHGKVLGRSLIPEYLTDICFSASTSLAPLSTTFPFKYSSPQNYQQP